MDRHARSVGVTIANGAALSEAFSMEAFSMGVVHMPAAWTAASIGFKVAATQGGTYLPLYDESASLVQISGPAVDKAYVLPPAAAAMPWVKLWSQDGSGNNTNQGGDRTITVTVKG